MNSVKKGLVYSVLAVTVLVSILAKADDSSSPSLQLDKYYFAPGEAITVRFTAPSYYPRDAWVGMIPSNIPHGSEPTNDQYDMTYQYVESRTSGVMTFNAPSAAGAYDFRMNDTDNGGKEVAYVSFVVGTAESNTYEQGVKPSLRLEKTNFYAGEKIVVKFTAPSNYDKSAWVGIIPSNVPHGDESVNDAHDIVYQYIQGRTSGEMVFTAPSQNGLYDLRMNDTDSGGREVAYVSFVVGNSPEVAPISSASLTLEKRVFAPGEEVRLAFTAPAGYPNDAWVGIIPSNIPHGSEATNDQYDITYQYLSGRTSGVLIFNAPQQKGDYDFRMHDTDNNGKEVAYTYFSVR